jgi:hypothetical protein
MQQYLLYKTRNEMVSVVMQSGTMAQCKEWFGTGGRLVTLCLAL